MPSTVLRPDAITQGDAFWTVTGAASHVAAVSDGSDSSYIQLTTGDNTDLGFSFSDPSIPVDQNVVTGTFAVRARHATGSGTLDAALSIPTTAISQSIDTTLTTYTTTDSPPMVLTGPSTFRELTRAEWVNSLRVSHSSLAFYLGVRIYDISLTLSWESVLTPSAIPVGF